MTTKRAVVLAGGGVAGISWQIGILRGIADESPTTARALLDSDVLVGTSAGSVVAAQISSGLPLEELFARQIQEPSAEIDPGVSIDDLIDLFRTAMTEPSTTMRQKLARIGAAALASETVAEPVRREVIAHGCRRMPGRTVRCG